MPNLITSILLVAIGVVAGIVIMSVINAAKVNNAKAEAKAVLEDAENKAKNTLKQAVLDGKTQVYDLKLQAEKEIKERRNELMDLETKLLRRED